MIIVPVNATAAEREVMVGRIIAMYESASDDQRARGAVWYRVAHDLARMLADGNVSQGAGVIAALSAKTEWGLNVRKARAVLSGDGTRHFPDALRKASAIMAGADPGDVLPMALKTGNFYRNILDPGDPDPVTIDRHAHDVAAGIPYAGMGGKSEITNTARGLSNAKRYALIAHCYREAAMRLGVLPSVVQSVTWLAQTESPKSGRS